MKLKNTEEQILTADLCRLERNTLTLPIFTFGNINIYDENGKVTNVIKAGSTDGIVMKIKSPDGKDSKISIGFDTDNGRPGEQDYILFRAIEEIAISYVTRGEDIPDNMYVGTIKSLGNGLNRSIVNRFISRMVGVRIVGKYSFFACNGNINPSTGKAAGGYADKIKGVSLYKGGTTISQHEIEGDNNKIGVYIELDDYYKNNLTFYYTKSIYRNYLQMIKQSTSRRLLEYIITRDNAKTVFFTYSSLCTFMQITQYTRLSEIKKQIHKIVKELEDKKIAVWLNHKNPKKVNKTDLQLFFRLRPLLTPGMKNQQLNSQGEPNDKKIVEAIQHTNDIQNIAKKSKKMSLADAMTYEAYTEEAAKINSAKLIELNENELRAIRNKKIREKINKRSFQKVESYDKHLIPLDAPELLPETPIDKTLIDDPF